MIPSTASILDRLRADPLVPSLPYAEIATRYNLTIPNTVRLVKLAGIKKLNAKSMQKAGRKQAFLDDPLSAQSWAQAGKKHGISRMTAFRYHKERGLPRVSRDASKDELDASQTAADHVFKVASGPAFNLHALPDPEPANIPAVKPPRRPRAPALAPAPKPSVDGKCHQRVIREQTLAEDQARLAPLLARHPELSASAFTLAGEAYGKEHREFIKRYEWLGTPGISIKWCFTARLDGELGGVVLMSEPYHPDQRVALIARGACAGWTPKNLASRLIMHGCRWMASNTDKREFIGYADTEAGEIGQIYQACNFKFLGFKETIYGVDGSGNRRSFQSLKRTSRMVPWLKSQGIILPPESFTEKGYLRWSAVPSDSKRMMRAQIKSDRAQLSEVVVKRGCYALVLGANKGETRRLNASFARAVYAYPKRDEA